MPCGSMMLQIGIVSNIYIYIYIYGLYFAKYGVVENCIFNIILIILLS